MVKKLLEKVPVIFKLIPYKHTKTQIFPIYNIKTNDVIFRAALINIFFIEKRNRIVRP